MATQTKSKSRRRRKPMSEEQRSAAAERLKLAREKRAKQNPPTYKNVHPTVLQRPDNDPLCFKNVKEWIKSNKAKLPALRQQVRQGVNSSVSQECMVKGYIANMEAYLKNGDWISDYYGEHMESRMIRRCVAMAFDDNGNPKRDKYTYYPDLGVVWGMEDDIS